MLRDNRRLGRQSLAVAALGMRRGGLRGQPVPRDDDDAKDSAQATEGQCYFAPRRESVDIGECEREFIFQVDFKGFRA